MAEPVSSGSSSPTRSPDDRLESWKEIAAYLKRDVTTVQRWERREGMPVQRHQHDRSSSVYAFRRDLDAWAQSRRAPAAQSTTAPWRTQNWRTSAVGWAVLVISAAAVVVWLVKSRTASWTNPLEGARVALVTHFEGSEHAAAISSDGTLIAFLSDRDGRTDVWLTKTGSGQFTNLTNGSVESLTNPAVRTLAFSPDDSLVTFWTRRADVGPSSEIDIWAVPASGGPLRSYLAGAAEVAWSHDGGRLVYHTPGPGDPLYLRSTNSQSEPRLIFSAPMGLHAHFPLWSPSDRFIYFVQGSVGEAMDVWRVRPEGGAAERITHHAGAAVSHPVLLDERTLLYLSTDRDGAGPWLYGADLAGGGTRRLSAGVDSYTSLSASGDGRRLVATQSRPRETLWRFSLVDTDVDHAAPTRIPLTTGHGSLPRFGPGYLVYVSSAGGGDAIWKLSSDNTRQLWSAPGTRVIGGAAVAPDGRRIALAAERDGRTSLIVMSADGSQARVVTESLALRGAPAWGPDGQSITIAATDGGVPRLFNVPLDGRPSVRLSPEYAFDPVWSPDGRFVACSGPDVGTTFRVKAVGRDGQPYPLPEVTLTRGARTLRFLPGRNALVMLRGDLQHKDLWLVDVATGEQRQITRLAPDFHVRDFDVSPDGREIVLNRVQEQSDIVLLDLARR